MENKGRILVVDDEVNARAALLELLRDEGYVVESAADAFKALGKVPDFAPDLVLTDLKMPGMDGLQLLGKLREADADLPVIVMTAFGEVETAVRAMRSGARDYLAKPVNVGELSVVVARELEQRRLRAETGLLRARLAEKYSFENIIGSSAPMQAVFKTVAQIAPSRASVLITGESGTGKELLAHALHACSPRADGPFVAINCAAIPESLLESELFGHERGAFTGAVRSRAGLFEQAHGGTLLLDEIGDMPPHLQTRLLRVLEDGRVRRIGGSHDLAVDVRLVAATAQRLDAAVAEGRFREDLFYRLNVLHIPIPPLRERREDLPLLAEALVTRASERLGRPVPSLSPEAMAVLVRHDWPGNVRQLENALERAVILAAGLEIRPEDLPPEIRAWTVQPRRLSEPDASESLSIKVRTAVLERELIGLALARTGGNRSQAARLLEISYKALVYKIREYGIES